MKQFRCSNCNLLLGLIEGKAEIKCRKCKTMNYFAESKPYNPIRDAYDKFMIEEIPAIKKLIDE